MEMPTGWFWCFCKHGRPYIGVLFLQLGYAVNNLLVKSALNAGLNQYTFSVYRNVAAAVAFGPFALYFERYVYMCACIYLSIYVTYKITNISFILQENTYTNDNFSILEDNGVGVHRVRNKVK